jgi:hypothetical protein
VYSIPCRAESLGGGTQQERNAANIALMESSGFFLRRAVSFIVRLIALHGGVFIDLLGRAFVGLAGSVGF